MDTIINTESTRNHGMPKKSRRLSDETSDSASARKHEKIRHPERSSPILPPVDLGNSTSCERNTGQCINQEYDQEDSGFDTGDSSDERKKKWHMARGRGGQTRKLVKGVSVPLLTNTSENYIRLGLSGV